MAGHGFAFDSIWLLNTDEAELPKTREDDDFELYLKGIFNNYISHFAALHTPDYVTQQIAAAQPLVRRLCTRILQAVHEYYRGFPHIAFHKLQLGIKSVRPFFDRLCTPVNVATAPALGELYRIRTIRQDELATFGRQDLYHVPFGKRQLVNRQRYSLPGLPCLYLGGTLYICWEELGRPNFDTIYYARFRPQTGASITFLDFGYRPALIAAMIDANQAACHIQTSLADFAVAHAVCWPLLAACSINRMHGNSPFIAEYVIPQLLLQWIAHSNMHDGIRYFSVRFQTHMANPAMPCNYVFPVKTIAVSGHCATLRGKFELSPPLSWQLIERMGVPPGMAAGMPVHGGSMIELVPGNPVPYASTPFGMIEAKSICYPCASF